ncbi:MAG TPA: cupin-like domain-containing protein [Rhodanobacteraceae bacterium]
MDVDELRAGIAADHIAGVPAAVTRAALVRCGVTPAAADAEIAAAATSPYTRAGAYAQRTLQKREWNLSIQHRLNKLLPDTVERRRTPSSAVFLRDYYTANRPVIITGAMEHWSARVLWNRAYFSDRFGDRMVDVQLGREADSNYEINKAAHLRHVRFGDFVGRVYDTASSNDFYMIAANDSANRKSLAELWNDIAPIPEYLDPHRDGGFLWLGPRGTITPFHHDLTNNFMAQVIGSKRLLLVPPCDTPCMHNHTHCFSEIDGREIDYGRFPDARGIKVMRGEIHPGDLLFLPVGWWHFVEALGVSATLTFTNFRWDNDFYRDYPREWA